MFQISRLATDLYYQPLDLLGVIFILPALGRPLGMHVEMSNPACL